MKQDFLVSSVHKLRLGCTLARMARRNAEYLTHLAQVPLFSALAKKDLGLVAKRAEDVTVKAGKTLVVEGATGHEFFVILSGTASVTRKGRKVATLNAGQWFGELALLDRDVRSASVTAATDMELAVIGQREFAGLIDTVPGFSRKLLQATARRLREYDSKGIH